MKMVDNQSSTGIELGDAQEYDVDVRLRALTEIGFLKFDGLVKHQAI